MDKGSKTLYRAGAGLAFLLFIILALAFVVPRLVDHAWLNETIKTEAAKQINGDFTFRNAELSLLPRPAVSLQQVSLVLPETARISVGSLRVYPRLIPLFSGKIRIAKAFFASPDFSLQLAGTSGEKMAREKPFSLAETVDSISAKLAPAVSALQGLDADVQKGTLRLFKGDKLIFLFEDINGSFAASSSSLDLTISCTANIWETLQLHATLVPGAGEARGGITLKNVRAGVLAGYFLPGKPLRAESVLSGLHADFSITPQAGLTADFQGSASSFTTLQENGNITVKVENLKGSMQHSSQTSTLTVDDLTLSSPQVQLSGKLTFDHTAPHAGLEITSQKTDITGIREVLPVFLDALYGDLPSVREIFAIIRGGTLSQAIFQVEGEKLADLAVFESMHIRAQVSDAKVVLTDLGLDLQGVTGDAAIDNGVLNGKNLQARLGNSTGSNGLLKLGLVQKETTPFHLDLDLNADLADVPPLLNKLIQKQQVLEYLSLIESIEGTTQVRLTLGASLESLAVRVEANKISGQAKYKPIPYPVSINGGRILYDGLKTESFNLQGKIGTSTFSNYSSRMNFEGEPTLEVESGIFHLVLDEIFPWLAADKRLEDDLQHIESLTGSAEVNVKSIKGPFLQPVNLQYELQCNLKEVELTAVYLPGSLKIKSGEATISPDKTLFENLQTDLLDSSLTFSAVLQNYLYGKTEAEIIVTNGKLGAGVNAWVSEELGSPKEYNFRTPLLISRAAAKWTREELLDLQGDFAVKDGPIFSIDIMLNPDELLLRSLALKNGDEQAKIKLALKRREIGAEFQGSLSKSTINNILLHNDLFPDAWIEGDIKFDIYMDSPATSIATGNLNGGDFIFPWQPDKPIRLHSFSLSAADKKVTLNSAEAVFEGTEYALNGQASLAQKLLFMDFDVKTGTVELDKIIGALKDEAADEKSTGKRVGKSWNLGLKAQINILADSMSYNNYTWEPFESRLTYENSSLNIEVTKAELCNIFTPGKLSFRDGHISLDFTMEAKEQELKEVLICLEGGAQQMTGVLDLHATIRGKGTRETLVRSLAGNLQYRSKDGYIYHDAQTAKLLSLLNVTDMFRGKIPDLHREGFRYDSLLVRGTMENGVLLIEPAKMEAPIMQIVANGTIDIPGEKINLQVLVAPLQTVNKIQEKLPVIRSLLPSSIVAIPVEVSGDFSDIKVRTLSMAAVTSRVFSLMLNALSTPVRVLEGASPK